MLFFLCIKFLKTIKHILIIPCLFLLCSCTGSRKYFKAGEKLEKQGLINEAAGYYYESLQRNTGNVNARVKFKEIGQKYISNLSSEFFRNYHTQQIEASLETFEKLKEFHSQAAGLNVHLEYPRAYDGDYRKAVETYCSKNYHQAYTLVNQKKFHEALVFIKKVEKYNPEYRNLKQLDIVATCEPLYQSAITNLENKNYSGAVNLLSNISVKTENYKDAKDLLDMATAQQTRSFILFEPKNSRDRSVKEIEDYLFEHFNHQALQKLNGINIINNTPFQTTPGTTDLNNSMNVDLIQAIRKATGADYFYVFEVANKKEYNSGLLKTVAKGYQEVKTKKNDTLIITEYKPFDYNLVKSQRSFSYDFKFKLINAYSNQIISSQTQNMRSSDAVEYQEFHKTFNGNINTLYPYNPKQTAATAQFNPRSWRSLFGARNNLKTFEELKNDTYTQNLNLFTKAFQNIK
jgi:hypothetical protein